jgi:hypothetical protein
MRSLLGLSWLQRQERAGSTRCLLLEGINEYQAIATLEWISDCAEGVRSVPSDGQEGTKGSDGQNPK